MLPQRVKIAVIGCGSISHTYLQNMTSRWQILDVVGCSDIIQERSRLRAEQFGIRQMTNEDILCDPDIEIVVNLTYPTAHYEVTKAILLAGKHAYSEKMLAVTLEEGEELVRIAKEKNLRLGVAPDTFLGASHQTARKLIDSGMIGEPVLALANIVRGYHPIAEDTSEMSFVFNPGGGIPFDMGGYYLNDLVNLLGPLARVSGFTKTRNPERISVNTRNPKYGEMLSIKTQNMLAGTLEFQSGVLGTISLCSECFEGRHYGSSMLTIFGTEGTLRVPDPNWFNGAVYLSRTPDGDEYEFPYTHGYKEQCCRGLGVADMAWAIRRDRRHRAHGDLGLHVFEAVHGIDYSGRDGKVHEMRHLCERPAALPSGYVRAEEEEHALDSGKE